MIKAVLFDLDDTLINHDAAIRSAAGGLFNNFISNRENDCQAFVERWISLNREWYKKFYAKEVTFQESARGKLREAFFPYGYEFSDTVADTLLSEYWERYVSMCLLFNDVDECFRQLEQWKVGVLTNGQENQQLEKLRRCGILSVLDVVITSEAVGFPKPAPEIFLHACNKMGVQPREIMYVGDNLELDAIAARNAGLFGVWFDRHHTDSLDSPGDVKRINRLTEVYEVVQQNL
ncbi:MAG: HAD family hydrolase [Nostoc sp. CmiSLP01]|nr:HAD family hydrolase [Nostoc sp. CmiSLP01]MDZ8288749.1 HAD family hydrolase [Nostoc sp. ChiSLP01]